ncbi:amidase signature enzyme [Patellaria atrata CBS 101060]|uniref:Amidase signature enzyme n=1 Tax=Patellaria atrata CBS 101060 TaxID=1346257 RepID=A0A9P4S7C1_9PEZI|nr:amidase signature enzyme [Patellaria atrata CBS 101060]
MTVSKNDPFDVLTATPSSLQALLATGRLTSMEIIEGYLQQISEHNSSGAKLRTMIPAAPSNEEHAKGEVRRPLHGIPIIVKAAFNTSYNLGILTTVGAYALIDSRPVDNAALIKRVSQCLMYSTRRLLAPGGSSTGSTVGVAAGFSPISLGIETSGSLTTSASRAALYALKLTPGSVNMDRVWQVAASFDTAGGMAKSVADIACLSNILLQHAHPERSLLVDAMQEDWKGISVGFVDVELSRLPPEARDLVPGYNEQTVRLPFKLACTRVAHPVYITPPENCLAEGGTNVDDLMDDIMRTQARDESSFFCLDGLENAKIKSLQDIIDFNSANEVKEFHPIIEEDGVDVIVAPCDSFFAGVGVAGRYPLASIPFRYVKSSGRPYGLHVIARANEENKIIKFISVWERPYHHVKFLI